MGGSTAKPLHGGPKAEVRRTQPGWKPGGRLEEGSAPRAGGAACPPVGVGVPYCRVNLARPGREQPKPGRSALGGAPGRREAARLKPGMGVEPQGPPPAFP